MPNENETLAVLAPILGAIKNHDASTVERPSGVIPVEQMNLREILHDKNAAPAQNVNTQPKNIVGPEKNKKKSRKGQKSQVVESFDEFSLEDNESYDIDIEEIKSSCRRMTEIIKDIVKNNPDIKESLLFLHKEVKYIYKEIDN